MKKVTKKILAVVLSLVMMVSVLSVVASAATTKTVKGYKAYTCLGDSIAAGFGLQDYNRRGQFVVSCTEIKGSYGNIVHNAVGSKYYPLAQPGFRTSEVRMMLDNDYDGDWVCKDQISALSQGAYTYSGLLKQRSKYQKAIKNSDLVTIDLGFNDTWYPFIAACLDILDEQPIDILSVSDAKAVIDKEAEKLGSYEAVYLEIAQSAAKIVTTPRYYALIIDADRKLLTDFYVNYAKILERIYEINPNVTVVAVGCYNPWKNWVISGTDIHFGTMLTQPLYDLMNAYKKSFVNTYGDKYKYADVTDTEVIMKNVVVPSFSNVTMDDSGLNPHPTAAGHKYIANQILGQLPAGYNASRDSKTLTKKNGVWGVYKSNGSLDTSFTGIAKTSDGTAYYVKKGKLASSFSGLVTVSGKKYYVKKGKVQSNYTGIVKVSSGSYYVKKGLVQTSFTGIATVNGTSYYIKSGKVATDYSGKVTTAKYSYTIKNGVVTKRVAR